MKLILRGGLIFFIGSIFLIVFNLKSLDVERNGIIVKMRIEKLPNSCLGTRVKHFTTLSYDNEKYIKRIGGKFCDEHNIGELIDIKYLKGSSVVLFPEESVIPNLVSFGVLGLLALLMIIYQWKK